MGAESAMRYQANDARVAWRVVEGEGVLLHAETSGYFGLNRTGTLLWQQIAAGPISVEELSSWTRQHLTGAPADPSQAVAGFIAQLLEFDLIDAAAPGAGQRPSESAIPPFDAEGVEYEPPQLSPFGELEKLILSGE